MTRGTAEKVVGLLLRDLQGRSGFDLDELDEETRNELIEKWIIIILSAQ